MTFALKLWKNSTSEQLSVTEEHGLVNRISCCYNNPS